MDKIIMYQSTITITLRPSILDVQGKAVELGIHTLGMKEVENVRIGKSIQMTVNAASDDDAKRITEEACKKLLANSVMEDYSFTIKKL
ncbi:MAG: phosphoribosylformylglycinamidine synthase subunit PurS [Bacteroidota bacterium]